MTKQMMCVSLILVVLTGCIETKNDNNDFVGILGPYLTVSQTEAAVGEFIEVTMTAELVLPQQSSFTEQSGEVELGLCLGPEWATEKENCVVVAPGVLDFQPSENFTIEPAGAISRRDFVTVKRGRKVEFAHTLRLTANRPGTVRLSAAFESYEENGYITEGGAKGPSVTFK